MTRFLPLSFAAALLACGGSAAPLDEDPNAPRPGLWETRASVGDISSLSLPPQEAAELKRAVERQPARRACFPGGAPKVGDPFLAGRCTYTKVADRDSQIERTAVCPGPDGRTTDVIDLTGTRAPERYVMRIVTRRTDAAPGRTLRQVETHEEGRRLGPCPGGGA